MTTEQRQQSLAEQIARCDDLAARPDLVLRLVDIFLLLLPPEREASA